MMRYGRIVTEFAGHPCALQLEKFEAFAAFLRAKALGETPPSYDARVSNRQADEVSRQEGNVAVIPVVGAMMQRSSPDELSETGMKLDRFQMQFRQALADDEVKAIVLDVDSPGGSVFGVAEVAQEIYEAREQKPIVAVANSLAASAAYWIASAAQDLVVTPGGQVGSIGVYTIHEDISQFLEAEGVRATIISAGKYKTEANALEPLGDEARQALQDKVDAYYGMFVEAVARNRNVSAKRVREGFGEGRVVMAESAVAEGMADRVGTLEDALARFGVEVRPQRRTSGGSRRRKSRDQARRNLEIAALRDA